jgi:hypothetical protein
VQQKEISEFWNPACVIGGKKEALRNTKSDSRAFRGPKAFIMIIINLIIDKSRLCYKIAIKY